MDPEHDYAGDRKILVGLVWPLRLRGIGAADAAGLYPSDFRHALYPKLGVAEGDLRVRKAPLQRADPGLTDLDAMLRGRSVDKLIVVGTATNVCCESTARDAMMLNYKVFFVSDQRRTLPDRCGAQRHPCQSDGHVRRHTLDRRDDYLVAEPRAADRRRGIG